MEKSIFYKKMDEIFDLEDGAITGLESLSDEGGILDSISMLGLISMLDKYFQLRISPNELKNIGTVDDLYQMINAKKI